MRVFQEEIFGPVMCVTTFKTTAEAIAIANDTVYGLGAGVFTRDAHELFQVGTQLRDHCGNNNHRTCFVVFVLFCYTVLGPQRNSSGPCVGQLLPCECNPAWHWQHISVLTGPGFLPHTYTHTHTQAYPSHAPFGGYKKSGFGRECHKMMLNSYRNTKNILISYDKNKLGFF